MLIRARNVEQIVVVWITVCISSGKLSIFVRKGDVVCEWEETKQVVFKGLRHEILIST